MNLEQRIEILVALGKRLSGEGAVPPEVISKASIANPWFTKESILSSIHAIATQFLTEEALVSWMANYETKNRNPKKIGLILAGNIPLVGIHDILTVFITGNIALIKLSERDTILPKFIIKALVELDSSLASSFVYLERLAEYDAVIATGSNSTGRYFEKYFSNVPHIIRKNRNAVAVVYKDSTQASMNGLSDDMLGYFGLGCRNVSKLYLEEGVEFSKIFEPLEKHKHRADHNKYKNNYDYTYALYLMNDVKFFTNDFFILRPEAELASRISTAHFEYFSDAVSLADTLEKQLDNIQCIVSDRPLGSLKVEPFGMSQAPAITDYADGVDTVAFILSL